MSAGLRFLLAIGVLHVVGAAVLASRRSRGRKEMPIAWIAEAGLAGVLIVAGEMFLFTSFGVPWSVPSLLALPLAAGIVGVFRQELPGRRPMRFRLPASTPGVALTTVILIVVAYAAMTARATSADLALFWGAKAERFAMARGIDVPFLKAPEHYLMHSDYPPLLPLLEGFGTLVAGRFPWGASLATLPWFLAIFAAIFHAGALERLKDPEAAAGLTAVATGVLGLASLVAATAGNADPGLLAFETAALVAVTSSGDDPSAEWAAGAALAGTVLLKIEGTFFAIMLIAGVIISRPKRRGLLRSAARLGGPPFLALGAWLVFCARHGLLDVYRGGRIGAFTLQHAGKVPAAMLRSADYEYHFLPWIALALAAFALRKFGFSAVPLWTGIGFLAANLYVYLHGTADPTTWIGWSAGRTLMTVLVCAFCSIGSSDPAASTS